MYFVVGFIAEVLLLFLLSKSLHKELGKFFYVLFKNEKMTVYAMAFIFLPGTFVHELAHYVTAELLRVRTGTFTIFPKIHGNTITLGSVQVEKTDPIRRFFIGVAPFLVGISLLLGIIYIVLTRELIATWWIGLCFVYGLFTLSNTMFSSKRDMEGALELILLAIVIGFVCYLLGVRIPLEVFDQYSSLITSAAFYLGITLGIDIAVLVGVWGINRYLFKLA